MTEVHVNPQIGMGGIVLGLLIQSVLSLYATSLVHRLELVSSPLSQSSAENNVSRRRKKQNSAPEIEEDSEWRVHRHSLPFMTATKDKPQSVPMGDLHLNRQALETQRLLEYALQQQEDSFGGHLTLSSSQQRIPWLLEVRNPEVELLDRDVFLEGLLRQSATRKQRIQIGEEDGDDDRRTSSPDSSSGIHKKLKGKSGKKKYKRGN